MRYGKGGKDRYVPLPQRTVELLREYWRTHRNPAWMFPSEGKDHIALKESTEPMHKSSVQDAFRAALKETKINKAASSYKLLATSGGLASATSGAFTINPGPADHLGFTLQPSTATTGATITPQVEVTAFDNQGNVATGFTGSVSLAITGTGGGALGGTTPKNAVGGTATFNDLTVSLPGNYQLDATSAGVTCPLSSTVPRPMSGRARWASGARSPEQPNEPNSGTTGVTPAFSSSA